MFDVLMFCSPGKAAGLLPSIVAKLAHWRLRTWLDIDVHEALLFVAVTKEARDTSAWVVAAWA